MTRGHLPGPQRLSEPVTHELFLFQFLITDQETKKTLLNCVLFYRIEDAVNIYLTLPSLAWCWLPHTLLSPDPYRSPKGTHVYPGLREKVKRHCVCETHPRS